MVWSWARGLVLGCWPYWGVVCGELRVGLRFSSESPVCWQLVVGQRAGRCLGVVAFEGLGGDQSVMFS